MDRIDASINRINEKLDQIEDGISLMKFDLGKPYKSILFWIISWRDSLVVMIIWMGWFLDRKLDVLIRQLKLDHHI